MEVLNSIKSWLSEHSKVWKIALVVVIGLVVLSVVRVLFLENEAANNEAITESGAELTSQQVNVYNNYSDDTLKFISILKNNRWTSVQKTANAAFDDKQIIERKNEDTHIQTYAICNLEKGDKDKDSPEECYYFTVLLSNGKYVQSELWIRHIGTSESSPIETIYIIGEELFWGSDSYERCVPADSVIIENWDSTANTLIDNKYDDMNKALKDYMYLYYPQIGKLEWNSIAGINFYNHIVAFNFAIVINESNSVHIVCEYNKDKGTFEVGKAQSADAISIKRTAV